MSSAGVKSIANEGRGLALSTWAGWWRESVKENSWEGDEEVEGGEAVDGCGGEAVYGGGSGGGCFSSTLSFMIF